MNRHTISLGRILGIPIGLDYSWFLIFVLITWTMAIGYYPAEYKNWPVIQYWLLGAATAIMLFVSVLLHELGHSVVAMRYKVPVKSLTLFIFGGVSQISTEPPRRGSVFEIRFSDVTDTNSTTFGVRNADRRTCRDPACPPGPGVHPWLSFGRLYPIQTNVVFLGWDC